MTVNGEGGQLMDCLFARDNFITEIVQYLNGAMLLEISQLYDILCLSQIKTVRYYCSKVTFIDTKNPKMFDQLVYLKF